MGDTGEHLVQQLAATQAITDVLHRYCRGLDRMDREMAESVWHAGGTADYVVCDLADPESVRAAVDHAVSSYGRLDVAFNNGATITPPGPVDQTTLADFDRLYEVNLPGVNPDNVNIEFEDGVLTIGTSFAEESSEETYTRRERYHGAYERSLRVPDSFDTQNAAARFENGVLYLTLPKKPEAQPLRIPISVSSN